MDLEWSIYITATNPLHWYPRRDSQTIIIIAINIMIVDGMDIIYYNNNNIKQKQNLYIYYQYKKYISIIKSILKTPPP